MKERPRPSTGGERKRDTDGYGANPNDDLGWTPFVKVTTIHPCGGSFCTCPHIQIDTHIERVNTCGGDHAGTSRGLSVAQEEGKRRIGTQGQKI